jgi:hypothetical protein
MNQNIRTGDSPTFAGMTLNGTLVLGSNSINDVEDIYLRDRIYHDGNTGTYMQFHATDQWRIVTNNAERLEVNNSAVKVSTTLDVTGRITPDTPADYDQTAVTSLTNAPIYYDEVNVGTTNTFLPAFHMRSRYTSGYRTHMNVGLYKRASAWGDNDTGFYIALGGNDSYPTKYWKFTYGHSIYNSEGYVTTPGSFRSDIFYNWTDTTYRIDGNGSSILRDLELRTNGLRLARNYTNNAIWFNGGTDANHVLWNDYYGGPGGRGAAGSGTLDGMKWNTLQGLHIRGGSGGAYDIAKFWNPSSSTANGHYVQLYANNSEKLRTISTGVRVYGEYQINDSNTQLEEGSGNSLRVRTNSGYVDMGPMNSSYAHFQTDRGNFYFNKRVQFDGGIQAYDTSDYAYFPTYYNWTDTGYYGDFNSTSRLNRIKVSNLYGSSERRFVNPEGGASTSNGSNTTGAIRIRLPQNRRNSSTMLRMTIKVYEYSTGRSSTFEIGGYNYGPGNWYNIFATQLTDAGRSAFTIRWGDDGSREFITIGETNTTWSYPQVYITEVQTGHSGYSTNWGSGWSVDFVTSISGVEQTRTASLVLTTNNTSNTGDLYGGNAYFYRYYDRDNAAYFTEPASISYMHELRVDDYIRHNGDTNTYILFETDRMYLYAGGRRMMEMDEGTDPDILQLGDSSTRTVNQGQLIVGDTTVRYSSGDNTPLVSGLNSSVLHVDGSIQLRNNADALIIGRGTSSFFKDEEIGFGWGGGWYMTEGSLLRVRNNKIVYSTNNADFGTFRRYNNTGYYLNPAAGNTSVALNTNGIINRIGFQTSGDGNNNAVIKAQDYSHWIWQTATDWGIFWAGNDNPYRSYWSSSNPNEFVFIGNGNLRASIDLDNGNTYFGGQVRASIYYDHNTSYYVDPAGTSRLNNLLVTGNRIGFINTSYDAEIRVNDGNPNGAGAEFVFYGDTVSGNAQLTAEVGNFYNQVITRALTDTDNSAYRIEPNSDSRLNNLRVDGTLDLNGPIVAEDYIALDDFYTVPIKSTMTASGTQARTFEIARISMDWNDWNYTGTFEVELHERYFGRGSKKTYMVYWGYYNGYQARLVENRTWGYDYYRVRVGSPVTISGDIRYVPVYVDVRYYAQVDAIIRTNRDVTFTDSTPSRSYAYINQSPGATNISDFSPDTIAYPSMDNAIASSRYYDTNTSYFGDFGSEIRMPYQNGGTMRLRTNTHWDNQSGIDLIGGAGEFRMSSDVGNLNLRVDGWGIFYDYVNSPIYYDLSDSGYYVNPRTQSRMSGLRLDGRDNQASGDDAILWVNKPNNNDWGIIVTGNLDYGLDLRMASSHTYGLRLLSGGSESFLVNNDFARHQSDMRAPIFYNHSNTGYYLNADGYSNLGDIRGTEIYARNWFRNDNSGEGLYNQATAMHWYSTGNRTWRLYGGQSTVEINMATAGNNTRGYLYATNSNEIGLLDSGGSWAIRHQNDNGTYFYSDNGSLEARIGIDTVGASYGTMRVDRRLNGWSGYSIEGRWVFMHDGSSAAGIYNDVNNEWAILMYRNSWVGLYYNGSRKIETYSGGAYTIGEQRADFYRDRNNSGYYVDPWGLTNLGRTNGPVLEVTKTGSAPGNNVTMIVRNQYGNHSWGITGEFRTEASGGGDRPSILFSSGLTGTTWSTGFGYADDNFRINQNHGYRNGGWGTARLLIDTGGRVYNYVETRTPFIYDNNDTFYYWDGNGTSRSNVSQAYRFANNNDVSSNTEFGLYFASSRSTAYAIYREGGGWSYRYPDLRIAFHTGIKFGANANYNGMRFYNDYNMATQVMSVNNATDPLGANNVYVNNNLQAGSSLRAPIIYDSNNTGYYFDGASGHSTRFEGANARTMAWLGQPGHTRDSGEYYRARPRITGDTNYWTGAMGWSRQDMTNTVADWGSGFIDSWSNPPNQPSGTSHWVGIQSYHYSNGSSRYGWQMVGGPIENLRFRSTWGGFRSWRTIPVLDINNGNGGSMYAGNYVDANDTGYYVNPNGTSQLRYVLANDWFRPQGATGVYFQSYGYGLWAVGAQGGQYGNVSTYGGGVNGWEGWSISGRSVFMHDGGTATGIYNDVNNEWMLYGIFNSYMEVRYNNSRKGRAESWGWRVDGDMRATSNVIAYYSDMRLKDKEGDIENALDKVGKLNGFYYRNNKEANLIGYEGRELQVGLSAQDVKSILPEIVKPAPLAESLGYDYMTIQYDKVVPLLVNAINEQKEIVDSQKEEIEYLKSELSEMKEMLTQLLKK